MEKLRASFTLIELLLVLVILSVLAAIVTPLYLNQAERARHDTTVADISNIKTALETFCISNGHYPSTQEGLYALIDAPSDLENTWNGPYLDNIPIDKWNHPYAYAFPSSDDPRTYSLASAGKDGEFGTADDITKASLNNTKTPPQ